MVGICLCSGALALALSPAAMSASPAPKSGSRVETGPKGLEDRPIKDKWALVIGIDKFEDTSIPTLQFSAKDARDFAEFLVSKGNFTKDHVLLLLNEQATDDNIKKALGDDWLPRRVLPDDLVVIFVSTHGSPKEIDVAQDNFLIAYNTHRDSLFSSGLRLRDLANTVQQRTSCDRIVLLLDACNSGAAEAGGKGLYRASNFKIEEEVGEGQVILSSSTASQRSWESKRYENGVFTKNLMDALLAQGDSTTLPAAYDDLKDKVQQEVRFDRKADQVPLLKSKWKGKPVALLSRPTKPRMTEAYQVRIRNLPAQAPVEIAAAPTTGGNLSMFSSKKSYKTEPASSPASGDNTASPEPPSEIDRPVKYMERALHFVELKSFDQAFQWYKKAADLGVAEAQGQLGAMYVSGTGIEQNFEEGIKWLEKAAASGDANAQGQLGAMFLKGSFVTKDYQRAFELINQASEKGNLQAQYLLGCMFAKGLGVNQSNTLARHWLQKASDGGVGQAKRVMDSLAGP